MKIMRLFFKNQLIEQGCNRALNFLFSVSEVCLDEYRHILSNTGLLSLFLAAQIIYPVLYPLPFYNGHKVVRDVPVAVIDNDRSSLSRQYIRMAGASESLEITARHTSLEEAKKDLLSDKISGIIIIPKGFANDIYSNRQTVISVYCDASYFYLYKQVLTGVKYVSSYMSAGIQIQRLQAGGMSRSGAIAARDPVPILSYPLFNPSNSYTNYLIPALLILILQQTLLIGVGFLGGLSYEQNRYHYFLPAVTRRWGIITILTGKAAAYMSIFLVHCFYFFIIIFRFHDLPMKSDIDTLMIYIIPFLLASIFLAISLSTIFRTREMAMLLIISTSIPFILVSGFSWPAFAMPSWLRWLSMLLPSTAGISGFVKISILGADLKDVQFDWLWLWGLVVLYFSIAALALKIIIIKSSNFTGGTENEKI